MRVTGGFLLGNQLGRRVPFSRCSRVLGLRTGGLLLLRARRRFAGYGAVVCLLGGRGITRGGRAFFGRTLTFAQGAVILGFVATRCLGALVVIAFGFAAVLLLVAVTWLIAFGFVVAALVAAVVVIAVTAAIAATALVVATVVVVTVLVVTVVRGVAFVVGLTIVLSVVVLVLLLVVAATVVAVTAVVTAFVATVAALAAIILAIAVVIAAAAVVVAVTGVATPVTVVLLALVALLLGLAALGLFLRLGLGSEDLRQPGEETCQQPKVLHIGRGGRGRGRGLRWRRGSIRCHQFDRRLLRRLGGGVLGIGHFTVVVVFQQVHFMAQLGDDLIVTDAFYLEMRGFQVRVGDNHHPYLVGLLDGAERFALLVEQVSSHGDRYLGLDFTGALFHHFFFDEAQDAQGKGFHITDVALSITTGAHDAGGLPQTRTQTLA